MKRKAVLLLALVIVMSVLAGCDGNNVIENEVPSYPVEVNGITVEQSPKAVASLSPLLTGILTDLGYTNRIVGYSTGEVLPKESPSSVPESTDVMESNSSQGSQTVSSALPKGEIGTALVPDMEKIGLYKPEIIFTASPLTKAQMDKLDAVNIKVFVMPAVQTIEEMKQRYLDIIKIMEGSEESETIGAMLMQETQRQLDFLKGKVTTKRNCIYICGLEPLVATGDTYESQLLSLVGNNLAAQYTDYSLTAEQIAALNPDVILYASDIEREHIVESPFFEELKAIADGKLIAVDRTLLLDQSKDVAQSVKQVAELLYPDIDFSEPEPNTESSSSVSSAQ